MSLRATAPVLDPTGCQTNVGVSIRRSHLDPASTILELVIDSDAESQTINVKTKTSFLIADENDHEVQAQVRVVAI